MTTKKTKYNRANREVFVKANDIGLDYDLLMQFLQQYSYQDEFIEVIESLGLYEELKNDRYKRDGSAYARVTRELDRTGQGRDS